jgi:hypothetical protein
MNNYKYPEDKGNSTFVEYIEQIPSNCIEVRYRSRRLISYAVYGERCQVSHDTTNDLRKRYGTDLGPLLNIEQENYPHFPIHIL